MCDLTVFPNYPSEAGCLQVCLYLHMYINSKLKIKSLTLMMPYDNRNACSIAKDCENKYPRTGRVQKTENLYYYLLLCDV